MNLVDFLKEVDQQAGKMSTEELVGFIYTVARMLPEQNRDAFLRQMKDGKEDKPVSEDNHGIEAAFEKIKEKVASAACVDPYLLGEDDDCDGEYESGISGRPYLFVDLNEEYDDWYNSDVNEFEYSDPYGILDVIAEACAFVHTCVDVKAYGTAYKLVLILADSEILLGGEYGDEAGGSLDFWELESENLADWNYTALGLDALTAAYFAYDIPENAGNVYRVMKLFKYQHLTLEMLMQGDVELVDFDKFLVSWIEILGRDESELARRLLTEAMGYLGDSGNMLDAARIYYKEHPSLYEQYLEEQMKIAEPDMDEGKARELLGIALEAMDRIDSQYIVRGRIALIAAHISLQIGDDTQAQKCWIEAFQSDTRIVNYLRIRMESKDYLPIAGKVKAIYFGREDLTDSYVVMPPGTRELQQNKLNRNTYYMLAFFDGEFQYVKEHAMNVKRSLGWSSTFMKCGIAAFLLLLLEETGVSEDEYCNCRLPGIHQMNAIVRGATGFEASEYEKGTLRDVSSNEDDLFWDCIRRWKKDHSIPKEEKNQYIRWLENLIRLRVDGIMESNHRNYYGECAAFVAALGEVKESDGAANGKQEFMLEYKNLYSRRRAFHGELRNYGMRR